MKKIGAKREIPNDIAFPARTGHDACEPFGSRANFESNKYSVELENHRMEMYSGEENCCNIVACTIFSIFFFIFTTLCVESVGDRTTLFVDAVRSTVQI